MRTTRVFRAVAVGAAAASAALGLFGVPGTAAEGTEDIVDVTVSIESLPATVAPAGGGVVYRVTADNGLVPYVGDGSEVAVVTGTLPDFELDSDGGCSVDSTADTYTCTVTDFPQSFDLRLISDATPSSYDVEATAVIESTAFTEPVEYQANNSDEVTTLVRPYNPDLGSEAFVCGGCTLTFSDPDVGTASLYVPEEYEGVFVTLRQDDTYTNVDPPLSSHDWNSALGIFFNETEAQYQVDDPANPVQVRYTPKQSPQCQGAVDRCAPLGVFDPNVVGMTQPKRLPNCDGSGHGINPGSGDAFVNGKYEICRDSTFKTGMLVGHLVLMKSKDPLLPPINI